MMKEGVERGRRVSGGQFPHSNSHCQLTAADGAAFGIEQSLLLAMWVDNLDRFLRDWDNVCRSQEWSGSGNFRRGSVRGVSEHV